MNPPEPLSSPRSVTPAWLVILLSALAGGMAWGIRGQFGHETGAMMAGVLLGYALILTRGSHLTPIQAARAVALLTVGISIGGQQTYGQVLGLTQDKELIGNSAMFGWGLLGTFVLGANWAGLGGLLFGIGLSEKRYSAAEMFRLGLLMIGLIFLGHWLLNLPFDAANHKLPTLYFSDDWSWKIKDQAKFPWKPRPEIWGGLLFAWGGLLAYVTLVKKDRLARNLGITGYLAGIGFPVGQCIQAGHAWNKDLFKQALGQFDSLINYWNMMEITFGTVIGITFAIGICLNRNLIRHKSSQPKRTLSPLLELILVILHLWLLVGTEFLINDKLGQFPLYLLVASLTAGMTILPMVGIMGGSWWPFLFPYVMVATTICGKTWLEFDSAFPRFPASTGLLLIVALPLSIATLIAFREISRADRVHTSGSLAARGLLWNAWLYFILNTIFFRFPFDLLRWTDRTHSQLIYNFQILLITIITFQLIRKSNRSSNPDSGTTTLS